MISKIVVEPDGDGSVSRFEVRHDAPIDRRLLQIVGLILDGGISGDELRQLLPTAQAYVDVDNSIEQQWVTDLIKSGMQ